MKYFVFILLLAFGSATYAQTVPAINEICKAVQTINRESSYTIKVLENEAFLDHGTDGGGTLTGYFKNGHLVKMVEWVGLSSCINVTEYYIRDNKLLFTYTRGKEFRYDKKTESFNTDKHDVTMEVKFYYLSQKMIKSILKGSTRCMGIPQNSMATDFQANCTRYIKLFQKS